MSDLLLTVSIGFDVSVNQHNKNRPSPQKATQKKNFFAIERDHRNTSREPCSRTEKTSFFRDRRSRLLSFYFTTRQTVDWTFGKYPWAQTVNVVGSQTDVLETAVAVE